MLYETSPMLAWRVRSHAPGRAPAPVFVTRREVIRFESGSQKTWPRLYFESFMINMRFARTDIKARPSYPISLRTPYTLLFIPSAIIPITHAWITYQQRHRSSQARSYATSKRWEPERKFGVDFPLLFDTIDIVTLTQWFKRQWKCLKRQSF